MNRITRRAACLGVLLCTLLALGVRLAGLEATLPYLLEPDGGVIPGQMELIQREAPQRENDALWTLYPHLVAQVAALVPPREPSGNTLQDHLAQASAPYVRVRLVCALLSLLAVPLTYALARRFLERGPALVATLLCAASLLSAIISPQARPHGPASAMVLFAVVVALRLRNRPGWTNCALAGLALGLAVSSLQSGIAAALPVAAAWWWRESEPRSPALRWLGPLSIAAVAGALAYYFYPHSATVPERVAATAAGSTWVASGHQVRLDRIDGSGFLIVARTLLSLETLPFLAALAGLLMLFPQLRRAKFSGASARARDLWVCCAYVVPYLAATGLYGLTVERFSLPLVPFLACAAAGAWAWCAARVSRPLAGLALALLVLPPLLACARLVQLVRMPYGAVSLAEWIRTHVDPAQERILLVPALDLPLARSPEALDADASIRWSSPWVGYQRRQRSATWDCARYRMAYAPLLTPAAWKAAVLDPLGAARTAGANWIVLAVADLEPNESPGSALRAALAKQAALVQSFPASSRAAAPEFLFGFDFGSDAWRVWSWQLLRGLPGPGRTVEIYRVP